MPDATLEQVYVFLKKHYHHERFEGRNGAWCPDYSWFVARSTLENMQRYGYAMVSQYESANGNVIIVDEKLNIFTPESFIELLTGVEAR